MTPDDDRPIQADSGNYSRRLLADPDRALIDHLANSIDQLATRVNGLHGLANELAGKMSSFISAQAERDDRHREHAAELARKSEEVEKKVLAFEAQVKLLAWVAAALGGGVITALVTTITDVLRK